MCKICAEFCILRRKNTLIEKTVYSVFGNKNAQRLQQKYNIKYIVNQNIKQSHNHKDGSQ